MLDPALAALVALNILWSGWQVIRDSLGGLMDAAAPEEQLAQIREVRQRTLGRQLDLGQRELHVGHTDRDVGRRDDTDAAAERIAAEAAQRAAELEREEQARRAEEARAEAARIEHVDGAGRGCFRNRPSKRLARRRAAARIGVIANAGNPGACGLRLST